MIQAVIFDFGGVILRTHDRRRRYAWDDRLGLARGTVEELVFNSQSGREAQHGRLTEEAHWAWLAGELDLSPLEAARLRQDFWAGDRLDEDLVAYIRRLRPAYQVAMISNAMDGLRRLLSGVYPIADAFDLIVISAEEGVMKPDGRIYADTLARLNRQPQEAVFVDDFATNVAGARAVDMHAIHFTPATDLAAELTALGVRPAGGNQNDDS